VGEQIPSDHLLVMQNKEQIDPFEHLEDPSHSRGLGGFAGLGRNADILFCQAQLPFGQGKDQQSQSHDHD